MQIGEVIRKHRKSKNMTQEDMAKRLGVTAPAVNKWENGNSFPDITLLAPIARLLDITLDMLLSFRENLTDDEVKEIIYEADKRFKSEAFEETFQWAKKKMELYPNCEHLTLWMPQVLYVQCCTKDIPDSSDYKNYIRDCYIRVLDSKDEDIRNAAADNLYSYYLSREEFEKAEEYLTYFSKQNPERKRKQAVIYSKTNRLKEAYQAYEELLFSGYQTMNMVFYNIFMLAMQEKDCIKAHMLVDKQKQLASIFEMGEYYEASSGLELAVVEKDVETTLNIIERMLAGVEDMGTFCSSALYEHMTFKSPNKEFLADMKKNLLVHFRADETFDFLKSEDRWRTLTK